MLDQGKSLKISYFIDSLCFNTEYIILLLAESDRSLNEITSKAEDILQNVDYKNKDSVSVRISKEILDDDLLGIGFYELKNLQYPTGTITINGVRIFDRYSYKISYRLE